MEQSVLHNEELPEADMCGESVDCNQVIIVNTLNLQKINEMNAKLKKEITDFLDIYDVLQYFLERRWTVVCGLPTTVLLPTMVIRWEKKFKQNLILASIENELFNSLDAGKDSAVEMLVSLSSYFQDRANNILVVQMCVVCLKIVSSEYGCL